MARLWIRPRGTLFLKLIASAVLVGVGDVVLFQNELLPAGLGVMGVTMAALLAIAQPAVVHDRRASFALALALLYGLAILYDASPLAMVLCLIALAMALLLPRTGAFDDGWRWAQRLALHGIFSVPGPLPDLFRIARARRARQVQGVGLRGIVPAVFVPVIGTLIFLALFAAANPVIEAWVDRLSLPRIDDSTFGRMVLWAFLLWLSWWLLRPKRVRFLLGTFDGRSDLALAGFGPASILLSLIAFNGIFLVQNVMDAAWLWGLLPLPDGITLASYAHRGAYPLIVTALLTALFVIVALRPGSATATQPTIRWLVILWIGQNLFLVFNAALRTVDYVEAYSLTILRIGALLWMGLVAAGLVLVLWRMLAGKSAAWLINANLALAGLLLTAVCYVDLGAISAQWNIRHAREAGGEGAPLDLCYLNALDGSALLPLIELEQRQLGGSFGERVSQVRRQVHYRLIDGLTEGEWQWLDSRRLRRADALLGGAIGPRPDERSCDGRPYPPPATPAPPTQPPPDTTLTQGREG